MLPSGKRKPSFKMVSNMVMQLLHSIKYSVEVPFSNIAQQPNDIQKMNTTKKVFFSSRNLFVFFSKCVKLCKNEQHCIVNFFYNKLNGYDPILGQVCWSFI